MYSCRCLKNGIKIKRRLLTIIVVITVKYVIPIQDTTRIVWAEVWKVNLHNRKKYNQYNIKALWLRVHIVVFPLSTFCLWWLLLITTYNTNKIYRYHLPISDFGLNQSKGGLRYESSSLQSIIVVGEKLFNPFSSSSPNVVYTYIVVWLRQYYRLGLYK